MSNAAIEPASSSSSDESSVSSTSSEESVSSAPLQIQSLDDLPSDDSVSLESTSDDDDDGTSESEEADTSDDEDEQHMTLQERVDKRRTEGSAKSAKTLHEIRQRKKEALVKAKERLQKSDKASAEVKKKPSKHAPTVASSKRRDYYQRGAPSLNSSGIGVEIGSGRYKARDPRFSAEGNTKATKHNYAFLKEKHQDEIKHVKKRISLRKMKGKRGQRHRNPHRAELEQTTLEQDEAILQRLIQQNATLQHTELQQEVQQVVQQQYHQQGYYPKRNKVKQITTELKYEQLKRKGGQKAVNKAVAKRRKKNKSKDATMF